MDIFKKIGFSKGDIVKIVWLQQAITTPINSKVLYDFYTESFPSVPVGYEYVAKIGKQLETLGALTLIHKVQQKKYYKTTEVGRDILNRYEQLYSGQFKEIIKVIDRIHFDLTHNGETEPIESVLPAEFRRYFAKLISVRDITRYMIVYLGARRTEFYAAEALDRMNDLYGWAPSNGYFYDIVREMEAEQTIKGKWKDPEKRTIRLISVTEDGLVFGKQIEENLASQVADVRKYLKTINNLLHLRSLV